MKRKYFFATALLICNSYAFSIKDEKISLEEKTPLISIFEQHNSSFEQHNLSELENEALSAAQLSGVNNADIQLGLKTYQEEFKNLPGLEGKKFYIFAGGYISFES